MDSEDIEKGNVSEVLNGVDAILVPGGFGERGIEGKIAAVQHARLNNIPYLGICLGLQVAVIEFARSCAAMETANSTEFDRDTTAPVIGLITEWQDVSGRTELRDTQSDLGGTMRLGAQVCYLEENSRAREIYGSETILERHRHRYEVNNTLLPELLHAGLKISGWSSDRSLVEMVELPDHPWFVTCQFHPEFTSTPRDGHPLFGGFVRAALQYHEQHHKPVVQDD